MFCHDGFRHLAERVGVLVWELYADLGQAAVTLARIGLACIDGVLNPRGFGAA